MAKWMPPALRTLLATRQFFTSDLYTITLVDGTQLRYCTGDADVTVINQNFLLQTDDLSQSPWSYVAGSISHNPAVEPYADALVEDGTFNQHSANQNIVKAASPLTYGFEIEVKAGTRSAVWVGLADGAGNGVIAKFNLATGVLFYSTAFGTGFTLISASVSDVYPDGYYRLFIAATTNSALGVNVQIRALDALVADTSSGYTGTNGDKAVYLRRPQLLSGSIRSPRYFPVSATRTAVFAHGGQVGPYLERDGERTKCNWTVGLKVDTLEFSILPGAATLSGVSYLKAARQGYFDGATLQLERAYMATFGDTSVGTVLLFLGRIADLVIDRLSISVSVNSHLELLDMLMPRNLYMPGCVNTLGDASCTVNLNSYAVNGVTQTGSTVSTVLTNALGQAAGYFDLGKVKYTSGANSGLWRSVKSWTPGTLVLASPFPNTPGAGDTFTVYPGCDRTKLGGCTKFSNTANFRGFRWVPQPETAV